jgi:V/A-type H+/Na+-transporting ATPase subunit E
VYRVGALEFYGAKGKAMAEELQHLIERIHKEGVESGEKAADALVAEAKKKAAKLVADAQKQAKDLVAKAEADAAAFAERGKKTLEQAARDLLISIGGAVGDVVGGIVEAKVGAALTPELVGQMLLKLAEAYGTDGGSGGIVAMLSESDAAAVKAYFAKEFQNKLAAGIQIESDKEIFKGFRVGAKGGQMFHDFTQEAIADSLANFLRPELAEIVKKAAE